MVRCFWQFILMCLASALLLALGACGGSSAGNGSAGAGITPLPSSPNPGIIGKHDNGGGGGGGGSTAALAVIATDPPDGAVGVQPGDPLVAAFNNPLDAATVDSGSFTLTDGMGKVVSGTVATSGGTATFTPTSPLKKSAVYHALLTTAITDTNGKSLTDDVSFSFTTTTDAWAATSTTGAPLPRSLHTAVWTGNEMIVWGGTNASDSGGRYDPLMDSWTSTTTTGAPLDRTDHTAVWDNRDDEMIVWGGASGTGLLNSGGVYVPATDTWASTQVMPPAPLSILERSLHTAVWTGKEMIVWGGQSSSGAMRNGARYDPATDQWSAVTSNNAPQARFGHTAVWTGKEMIVWGGNGAFGPLADGARYDPAANKWSPVSTAPITARSGHTAVWTGREMIVWGGSDSSGTVSDGASYDPATDTWQSIANAPVALSGHTAVWTGTEMIVWGGNLSDNSGAAYNPRHNTWRLINTTDAPTGRTGQTAVWTGTQMIVWGGNDSGGDTNSGGIYTP